MKLLEGVIFTKDMERLAKALEAKGLIVHEIMYDGCRKVNTEISKGVVSLYNLINRVKIRTIINDELVGTIMDILSSFGDCKFVIFPEELICPA
jgi:nitrogen regulatory protein PII